MIRRVTYHGFARTAHSNQYTVIHRTYDKLGIRFEESYGSGSQARHYSGILTHKDGLSAYLSERVQKRYHGQEIIDETLEEFPDLYSTGFKNDRLVKIRPDPKPWQVGESFSECFLEDHMGARLPYPGWRDLKNQSTPQAGADLVGYRYQDDSAVFLFGEVKTSAQTLYPPPVINDLKKQLQVLGSSKTTLQLILWFRGKRETPKDYQDFSQAILAYVKNVFKITGVLIRDIFPDGYSLEGMFTYLSKVLYRDWEVIVSKKYWKTSDLERKVMVT